MKKLITFLLITIMGFCFAACDKTPTNNNSGTQDSNSDIQNGQTEVSLPEGTTLDSDGNLVVELNGNNWSEYFYFTGELCPEGSNDSGISNFVAFSRVCLKEEYKSRVVRCDFQARVSAQKSQGFLLKYDAKSELSVCQELTEEQWNAFKTDVPYTQEFNMMAFDFTFQNENIDKGILCTESRISIYQLHTERVDDVYSIPAQVFTEFVAPDTNGTITLKP